MNLKNLVIPINPFKTRILTGCRRRPCPPPESTLQLVVMSAALNMRELARYLTTWPDEPWPEPAAPAPPLPPPPGGGHLLRRTLMSRPLPARITLPPLPTGAGPRHGRWWWGPRRTRSTACSSTRWGSSPAPGSLTPPPTRSRPTRTASAPAPRGSPARRAAAIRGDGRGGGWGSCLPVCSGQISAADLQSKNPSNHSGCTSDTISVPAARPGARAPA